MEYPKGFPERLQRPVDEAIAEAEAGITAARLRGDLNSANGRDAALLRYSARIYFAFGQQVCQAVKARLMTGEAARRQMAEFLGTILHRAYFDNFDTCRSLGQGAFESEVRTAILQSKNWLDYQQSLAAALAESKALSAPDVPEAVRVAKPRSFREPNPGLLSDPTLTLNRLNAAEALGISSRTLDRWIADGTLTPVGTGSRKRFKVKELQRLLNQKLSDKRDTK